MTEVCEAKSPTMTAALLTALALIAFAANSLLARAALLDGTMSAAGFTAIRILSGAAVLMLLLVLKQSSVFRQGSWRGAAMLLLYAGAFSWAYLQLDTGTGALVLFTAVQLTILGRALMMGQLSRYELVGAAIAFAGFVYLVWPTLATPLWVGAALMSASGIGWGIYTLMGRESQNPLADTAGNFFKAGGLVVVMGGLAFLPVGVDTAVTPRGIWLAVLSGSVTSGIGYAIWYSALPRLSRSLAATVQLLVPPLATLMGAIALNEPLSSRLALSIIIISLGIGVVIYAARFRRAQ